MSKKKKIRKAFRNAVFKRDNYTCKGCGLKADPEDPTELLDAHHITDRNDMPNGGYVLENGISLCKAECHEKAEVYHKTGGQTCAIDYHPMDLYNMIGSSKELAEQKSEKL